MFSLELGSEVAKLECNCCNKPFHSVCGFIKKDDWAYSVYFAKLNTGQTETEVGLTLSIGKWWDDSKEAIQNREWVYLLIWPSESGSGFEIRLVDPSGSRHIDNESLGRKITEDEALVSSRLHDFFDVAKFVIDNDPAVLSYLNREKISSD
jgi:hypothetical protein